MTTSGNTISQLSRNQIINGALRKCGVLSQGQTANASQLSTGGEALNALVTEFQVNGMPLWARKTLTITLVSGTSSYTIGDGQTIDYPFPLRVYQGVLNISGSDSQIDMRQAPLYDFNLYPTSSTGSPVVFNYTPKINLGVLQLWPEPDSSVPSGSTVTLTYQAPFEVFDSSVDTPDFPQEWANALIYGLAMLLAPEYTLPVQTIQMLEKQAGNHLMLAMSNGAEEGSIFMQPEPRWK